MLTASYPSTCPRAPAVMAASSEGRVTLGALSNGERVGIGSVCVCVCACMRACVHVCVHACVYAWVHVCMYVCVCVCICPLLCVGTCFTLCVFTFSTVWCLCVVLGSSEPNPLISCQC